MASQIIGRARCPECGFESAHVKQSDKCLYRYCPSCGINGPHARTEAQRENMKRGMRPVAPAGGLVPTPTPTPTAAPAPAQAATPTEGSPTGSPAQAPAAPPKRRGLFG